MSCYTGTKDRRALRIDVVAKRAAGDDGFLVPRAPAHTSLFRPIPYVTSHAQAPIRRSVLWIIRNRESPAWASFARIAPLRNELITPWIGAPSTPRAAFSHSTSVDKRMHVRWSRSCRTSSALPRYRSLLLSNPSLKSSRPNSSTRCTAIDPARTAESPTPASP